MRILLIDDTRSFGNEVTKIAKNYKDGIEALKNPEGWDELWLDHDLADFEFLLEDTEKGCTQDELIQSLAKGLDLDKPISEIKERTGYDVICWLEEHPEFLPKKIKIVSSNPVGRKRMQMVIDKLYQEL